MVVELSLDLTVLTSLRHIQGYGATLFLYQSQMLQVLICLKKEFTRVKLNKDASHRPNVSLLVPSLILQYDFRSPVLPCVDDQGVRLSLVCRSTEVYYLNIGRERFIPTTTVFGHMADRARVVAGVLVVATLLTAKDLPLILNLL